jgi:hypothetical protein
VLISDITKHRQAELCAARIGGAPREVHAGDRRRASSSTRKASSSMRIRRSAALMGYSLEELLGHKTIEFIAP